MAKLRSKGCVLQQTISSVLTTVAQVISMDSSGEASLDFDSTTLDQSLHYETKDLTGYASPGTFKFELFYDPALAGHIALRSLVDGVGFTPVAPQTCVFKIKYSDATAILTTPSSTTFSIAGISMDEKFATGDGIKMSVTMNKTSSPTKVILA